MRMRLLTALLVVAFTVIGWQAHAQEFKIDFKGANEITNLKASIKDAPPWTRQLNGLNDGVFSGTFEDYRRRVLSNDFSVTSELSGATTTANGWSVRVDDKDIFVTPPNLGVGVAGQGALWSDYVAILTISFTNAFGSAQVASTYLVAASMVNDYDGDGIVDYKELSGGQTPSEFDVWTGPSVSSITDPYENEADYITLVLSLTPNTIQVGETAQASTNGGNLDGGAITFAITGGTGAAQIDVNTGAITGTTAVGTVELTATQAANPLYISQTATALLTVEPLLPSSPGWTDLNAGPDVVAMNGDAGFTQVATGGNGGPVTYASSDTSVATVDPNTGAVTIIGGGTTTITATEALTTYQSQDDSYELTVNPARSASPSWTTLTVTITPDAIAFNETAQASTNGGNNGGGAITYAITGGDGAAVIDANTGVISGVTTRGTVEVTATQAANANFEAQTATASLLVGLITPSSPDWTDLNAGPDVTAMYGDAEFIQAATGGNGGPVTYASSDTSVATVDANTGAVSIVGRGTATITATEALTTYQSQDDSYELTVNRISSASPSWTTLTVTLNPDAIGLAGLALASTNGGTTGGGAITYAITGGTGVAVIDNNTGVISGVTGAGTVEVTATQAETANYEGQTATAILTVSNLIGPSSPSFVALDAGGDLVKKDHNSGNSYVAPNFTQAATGGNGGAITYTSSNPAVATVDATTGEVSIVEEGTTTITATEASTTFSSQSDSYVLTVTPWGWAWVPSTTSASNTARLSYFIGGNAAVISTATCGPANQTAGDYIASGSGQVAPSSFNRDGGTAAHNYFRWRPDTSNYKVRHLYRDMGGVGDREYTKTNSEASSWGFSQGSYVYDLLCN